MTSKPETVLKHIRNLENQEHSDIILEFHRRLTEKENSSARNASTYFKILRILSVDIKNTKFDNITKEDIITFLDKRKNQLR